MIIETINQLLISLGLLIVGVFIGGGYVYAVSKNMYNDNLFRIEKDFNKQLKNTTLHYDNLFEWFDKRMDEIEREQYYKEKRK